jgi:LysR family nitrogen assimilation transcriptional regulator
MDIRQLRYFIAIVETGSFSRAAERLCVAQPALSQHVLAMEAALGVTLLQRNPRGVVLTEAGQRLLERARDIDGSFQALDDYVRGITTPAGDVRFGMPATINEQLGVPLIESALEKFPKIRIRISEAMSGFVLDWLRDGIVDIALLYNVIDEKGLILQHVLTEEIRLFGRPDMKGIPRGESLTLGNALRLPLILPGPAHGLRQLIETAAQKTGTPLEPAIEIDSYRQIKQLAMRGIGYGMLPATAIRQEVLDRTFFSWRVTNSALVRRIYLGSPKARPLSAASRAVSQLSLSILNTLVSTGAWPATWADNAPPALGTKPTGSELAPAVKT